MVSTGGANDMTIEERTTGLEAKPDISGVESGSMNFGDETFITPPPAGRGIVERATDAGIALEVEAFDVGHVVSAVRWLEEGILPPPLRINLVFGVPGGIDASPEALAAMLRPLPPETFWTVTCIGRHHRRMLALALLHGAPGHPHRPRGRRLHQPRRAGARRTRRSSRWRSSSRAALGPRGRDAGADLRAAAAWLTRRGPETREAIHAAALELFARLGYHATSMRAIAAAARVQPAAIYHWYSSKEAILVALQDDFMERLTEQVVSRDGPARAPGAAPGRGRARARRLPRRSTAGRRS